MLHDFIAGHRQELIDRCEARLAARPVALSAQAASAHEVAAIFDQLGTSLRAPTVFNPDPAQPGLRGAHDRLFHDSAASDVVRCYDDVYQVITGLAVEMDFNISADDFRLLNHCLNESLAGAVNDCARQQNHSVVDESTRADVRAGFVAHEMRNLLNTALLAFEVLKTGNVGVGGSSGAVLHRSLVAARALTGRSLAEIRLAQGAALEQFPVAPFIRELAQTAALEGHAHGIALRVMPVEDTVVVEADRQVLSAVVINLLQNAFKFTRPGTSVVLRASAPLDRVLIEVQDECGGLAGGNPDALFRPFEQYGADRSGLGLGLAFSRWAVEQNNGRIYVRDLPEQGCVFTVDLPRIAVTAGASV